MHPTDNLRLLPTGSGPTEHPGVHSNGGLTYNQYGPPQNYKNPPNPRWWEFWKWLAPAPQKNENNRY